MKNYILPFLMLALVASTACEDEDLNFGPRPEGLTDFSPASPLPGTTLVLNSGTPDATVVITWSASEAGLGSPVTYVWQVDVRGGDFSEPLANVAADNDSLATQVTLDYGTINSVLSSAGVTGGAIAELDWRVLADNGSFTKPSSVYSIDIRSFAEGIGNFGLTAPATDLSLPLNRSEPATEVVISWEAPDLVGTTEVSYEWLAVLPGGDFSEPAATLPSDNEGADPQLTVTNEALLGLIESLAGEITDATLQWTVRASTGEIVQMADDVHSITLEPFFPIPDLFFVGDATEFGWDNNSSRRLYQDPAQDSLFSYTGYFNAGAFKALSVRGQWQPQWGPEGAGNELGVNFGDGSDPGVVSVPSPGFYSVTMDLKAMTWSFSPYEGALTEYTSVGIIGSATPAGWDADTDMTQSSFDPHIWTITLALVDGECKFRANDGWDVNWGPDNAGLGYGSTTLGNPNNIAVSAGTYEVQFNDLTGQYSMIPQ